MGLANEFYINKFKNVSIISPDQLNVSGYNSGIIFVVNTLKSLGIKIPKHTVVIFPAEYSNNEVPVSYIDQRLIFLFPLGNTPIAKTKFVIFQYLHELGHLLTGNFAQHNKWVGELLACSCNFFFFPKDDLPSSFYNVNITKNVLDADQIKVNYALIKDNLLSRPNLVYNSQHPIQSALYTYSLSNKDFNFVALLTEFINNKNNSEELPKLILKILNIINYGTDKIEFID